MDFSDKARYDFHECLIEQKCVHRMILTFGDKAPPESAIYNSFIELYIWCRWLSNKVYENLPETLLTAINIDAVQQNMTLDRYVSYS